MRAPLEQSRIARARDLPLRLPAQLAAAAWLALGACSDEDPRPSDQLALNAVDLPALSCREAVESSGECARRDDCGHGQLCTLDERVAAEDRAPLALRCGPPLGTNPARARCSQGAECESGMCGLAGVCLEPCAEQADCPRGQSCQPVEARVAEDALAPVQACARVAAFAPNVTLSRVDVQGLRAGRVNRLSVDASQQTNLIFLKADCARSLRVERIVERASGRVFFDLDQLFAGVVQINPSINEGALLPLLLPNNPRISVRAPGYDLGVSVDADADLQVIQAARNEPGHILDLNVFYVGGGKQFDPSGLHPGSSEFGELIAQLGERYAAIGIELGAVREYDVVGALRSQLSVLEVTSSVGPSGMQQQEVAGLAQLFELSAGVEDGGVNLFVIERMGALLGISGGTPGALGLHGSALSGVALALDSAGLARAEQALFHELGHQLGLFHTSELDGFEIEPLSDTPACTADQDADGDGVLRASECADFGADNVMFWEGGGSELSPQQGTVLGRALVLR